MKTILALDQSTSATKGLLFDQTGRVIDQESCPHEQHYPQPGWVEHDAEAIYQNTVAVLNKILARNSDLVSSVVCLSITNQRETVVVFDRTTGKPLRRAIVWQCRRGEAICRRLTEAGHGGWGARSCLNRAEN